MRRGWPVRSALAGVNGALARAGATAGTGAGEVSWIFGGRPRRFAVAGTTGAAAGAGVAAAGFGATGADARGAAG